MAFSFLSNGKFVIYLSLLFHSVWEVRILRHNYNGVRAHVEKTLSAKQINLSAQMVKWYKTRKRQSRKINQTTNQTNKQTKKKQPTHKVKRDLWRAAVRASTRHNTRRSFHGHKLGQTERNLVKRRRGAGTEGKRTRQKT